MKNVDERGTRMSAEAIDMPPTELKGPAEPQVSVGAPMPVSAGTQDPAWARRLLIGLALAFMGLMLVLPLVSVFAEALHDGVDKYFASIANPDAWSAIRLTLIVAGIAVPLNLVFGLCAAWAIAKFEFRGKSLLIT